jgi:hypothetical protein
LGVGERLGQERVHVANGLGGAESARAPYATF